MSFLWATWRGRPTSIERGLKSWDAVRVARHPSVFCDEVYEKIPGSRFSGGFASKGYKSSTHGGIPNVDMLYLGGDTWVRRDLIVDDLEDPVLPTGQPRADPKRRLNNGILGDGRRFGANSVRSC